MFHLIFETLVKNIIASINRKMVYLIKQITLDDKQAYESSKTIGHTKKTISNALILLENQARDYVRQERGREIADATKIIEIYKFDQINEPQLDTMLLYKIADDPHRIHVYQKKTVIVKSANWTWGTTDVPVGQFRRTHIFEIEEYVLDIASLHNINLPQIEMVEVGPARIRIPKSMTVAPLCDLIDELKKSEKFRHRLTLINSIA